MTGLCLALGLLATPAIDRPALVARHPLAGGPTVVWPLGNGQFCVGVDGTGLQTLAGNTMAHWGWHSFPLPAGVNQADLPPNGTFARGRPSGPDVFPAGTEALRAWLFDNPHRLNLARWRLVRPTGQAVTEAELGNLRRSLDLWTGRHRADFELDAQPVVVETVVHGDQDSLAVRVTSPLITTGALAVSLSFGYPTLDNTPSIGDFDQIEEHSSALSLLADRRASLQRVVDDAHYAIGLSWSPGASLARVDTRHEWRWTGHGTETIELGAAFAAGDQAPVPSDFDVSARAAALRWRAFWMEGGAIDLSASRDPRWRELERRIVLSQYQLGCQSAGDWPPAETGLLGLDPWRGQFHGEMIWWHLAHWALWGRWPLAERGLECYQRFAPGAASLAAQLGQSGLKWPKSVGPEGRSAPWLGNQVLLWKQPHPIFFAELAWRDSPTTATLQRWWPIVSGTADNLASAPTLGADRLYHLDPVMPPSEQGITRDAVFDLAYWRYGLDVAQRWRTRLGLEPNAHWAEVRNNLAPLPTQDGVFVHSAEWHDTYTSRNWEHPDPVGVLGMLPPLEGVDGETARRTVERICSEWQWERCWGWDFPWTAMAAARCGRPDLAVDILLSGSSRNAYDERGVNTGGPCPYLPGNGGLLYAVAMMAAGWDGAPETTAPGFPADGSWIVRCEDLRRAP